MTPSLRRAAPAWSLALGLVLAPSLAAAEPARFEIDPSHLSIGFSADHIGYTDVLGLFLTGGGHFVFDETTRTLSEAVFTVDAASVFSNDERRDGHLRGADFLDAENHPEIRFVMTEARAITETTGVVAGELTMRGVTRPIDVEVAFGKAGDYPFGGTYVIGVTARAVVKRSDFGSTYAVENGWVGDEIPVTIALEAVRQD